MARDDLWSWGEQDVDEAVFSVLNLDHERFLSELDLRPGGLGLADEEHVHPPELTAHWDAAGGDADPGPSPRTPASASRKLPGTPSKPSARMQRVRRRIAADVARGRGCDMLRANINALRRARVAPRAADAGRAEDRAAAVLQAAWRRFVLRHVFLHLREVVRQLSAGSARAALQSVNPREALLADAASDIVVRFRLARDEGSPLPVVVYKVFTRWPVVDVCRGCCGRLLFCTGGDRTTRADVGEARAATAPESRAAPAPCGPGCAECRSRSVCCLLFASYKRVDNNHWRPCPVGLFDPDRCPARGRGAARCRPQRPPAKPRTATTARKPSAQEKERVSKIEQLRKLYGYDGGQGTTACLPPPPSLSSKANTFFTPDNGVGAAAGATTAAEDGGCHEDAVVDVRAVGASPVMCSASDVYYDRLMAAWGM